MELLFLVNKVLAFGVIISQVFIVLALIYIFLPKKSQSINKLFSGYAIKFSFIIAFVSTCGSLFYSNYAGFNPCTLCWFQRIFMYPEVIILGLAIIKKEEKIVDYGVALAGIGWIISAYHNYIYIKGLHAAVCNISEPCTAPYVTEFGYITIPMMAITAFTLINLFLIVKKYNGNK